MKYVVLLPFFFFMFLGFGQSSKMPDSLLIQSDKVLKEKAFNLIFKKDSLAKIYLQAILQKANESKDSIRIARAYFYMNWLYDDDDPRILKVLDSAISYRKCQSNQKNCNRYYNRKALVYNDLGKLKKTLEYYLKSLEHSKKFKDINFENLVKHNIGILKRKLGKYNDAKNLFNKVLKYEENEMITKKGKWDSIGYLETLAETVSVYRLRNKIDSASILNVKGSKLARNMEVKILFELNHAILGYYDKEYTSTIQKLDSLISKIIDAKQSYTETYNVIEAYLYIALSYKELGDQNKSIENFRKTDSIGETKNQFLPEIITAQKELVNYYKTIGDQSNQLKYINKLLKSDSILTSNYKIVGDQLFKEFDAKELVVEKEEIIASLEKENAKISTKNIIISLSLVISLAFAGFYFYRQRLYKKRFLKLIANASKNDTSRSKENNAIISEETIQYLLECLHEFENSDEFLNPDISLVSLAKSFNSNSNYLSKVINKYKKKNFAQYVNDLRINYIIDRLKDDPVFRKYSVVALAQEIGFKNSESFSKAFYKKTGIYPSYFVKELLKQ